MMNKFFLISSEMGDNIRIETFDSYRAAFLEMKARVDNWDDCGNVSFTNNTATVYNERSMWTNKYRIITIEELMSMSELKNSLEE